MHARFEGIAVIRDEIHSLLVQVRETGKEMRQTMDYYGKTPSATIAAEQCEISHDTTPEDVDREKAALRAFDGEMIAKLDVIKGELRGLLRTLQGSEPEDIIEKIRAANAA